MHENEIAKAVVDAAFKVHTKLGPGLLESVYEVVLAHELRERGLKVVRQVPIAIEYEGHRFSEGYTIDLMVNDSVVVELKSIEAIAGVHKKNFLLT